ncbi:hypothetical protein [Lactococcus lactis]|uniref:hypothetical protein n=1 Tax=Lactococcus lactis TaxID=1358 RepID=UPI00288FDD63|nr:hypothetical protein [Lactococcus lactis]MDT2887978.1 hypothetical protein [Lactococcus lactis]MDT2930758.1 hypothetical protein [Lactococcus lactis]
MKNEDPVLMKIKEKKEKIEEEVRLIAKHQNRNKIVIATSVLLLVGIIIGIFRIVYTFIKYIN